MHEMSFSGLVKDNPEWVSVFITALFALITTVILIWQVCVMKWQGRNSDRHERIQNRFIRLQHEHEWVLRVNAEREQVLKLARKLHLVAGCLSETPSAADQINWGELQDTVYELNRRLSILDFTVYSGPYDQWYFKLENYVEAVQQAVIDDRNFPETYGTQDNTPTLSTRKKLKAAGSSCDPIDIFLNIESSIRMEFFEFKGRWDALLRAEENGKKPSIRTKFLNWIGRHQSLAKNRTPDSF